ncbi:MAG: alpha-glucosidase C-terminal domain-containing protein [Candidatus Marinimicrobia bacterium]|nr:alpha-glucosidase C-terminal domain-containing protein [Candidatus Neomarinimicrobiota bacterium]
MSSGFIWWRHGVIYQIYPRSFMDSNGDGVGDLQGIIDRLDYLVTLGIDAIWISPFFTSPMRDYGYDISDYKDVHPMFGDLATFGKLLAAAHERNLRVVLDYVPNHTSDQHPWFVESRSALDNPKRDWYIWKDAKPDGSPPNNWEAIFGGPAWEWDQETQQYYLHLFLKEQPDLNWRNPEVVEAMHDVLRFWLDQGVDGFRMDAVIHCIKHAEFPDNPPIKQDSPYLAFGLQLEPVFTAHQPEIHEILRGFRSLLDSYHGERVMIGETWAFQPAELVKYYGTSLDEFHIPYNLMGTMMPWNVADMKQAISAYYAVIPAGAAPNFVFGSHDVHRFATRFGPENHRSAAMLLLTLWGIPTMYYGDELAMENVDISAGRRQDTWGQDRPDLNLGRDPERTPMQWEAVANAGFSPPGVEPWLPIASNYQDVNVATQQREPASTLNFYQALLKLRRAMPALHRGDFAFVDELPAGTMAYIRTAEGQRVLVVINFAGREQTLDLSSLNGSGQLLLSSQFSRPAGLTLSELSLNPHESLLVRLP